MVKLDLTPETRKVFKLECLRSAGAGVIESAGMTLLLLIAIRYFHLSESWKSLVATAGSLGLILGPLIVYWVQSHRIKVSIAGRFIAWFGGAMFLLMVFTKSPIVFALLSVAAMTCSTAKIPLISSLHQKFFPATMRGTLFSRAMMIRILSACTISILAGKLLQNEISHWPWVVLVFGLSFVFIGFCYTQYPAHILDRNAFHSPFSGLHWLKKDRIFFWTIVSWMIMGFGNLMMLPLRVEYLSDENKGVWVSAEMVTFLTVVIPGLVRLVCVPIWGAVFDRISLFRLRILLNLFFAIHIFLFFHTDKLWALILAGAIFGVAHSGGDVAWNLWVTRLAPCGRAADYMAVHTFMTGIRGLMAPFVGFWMLTVINYHSLSVISGCFILVASLFVLKPAIQNTDLKRTGKI